MNVNGKPIQGQTVAVPKADEATQVEVWVE